jgi:hypothetical protein
LRRTREHTPPPASSSPSHQSTGAILYLLSVPWKEAEKKMTGGRRRERKIKRSREGLRKTKRKKSKGRTVLTQLFLSLISLDIIK